MTVSTLTNSVVYTGNSGTTQFAVPFKVLDVNHLTVKRLVAATGAVDYTYVGTEFSYAGIGASAGTLTLNGPALSATYKLQIRRIVPYTQDLDLVNAGGFYPDTVEAQLDLMTMGLQQVADSTSRALVVPAGETIAELPAAGDRASKILGFDVAGLRVLRSVSDWLAGFAVTVTAAAGASVSTRGALAGIVAPALLQTAYLAEVGREGWFKFSTANNSANVTNDPGQGIYVAPAADVTGASGAWVRVMANGPAFVNVTWFGATGDNVTDDTTAIQRATNYILSIGVGTVFFPDGRYYAPGGWNLPAYNPTAPNLLKAIKFMGLTPPSTLFGTASTYTMSQKGAIIRSDSTVNDLFAVTPYAAFISFYKVEFENLVFRLYDNPQVKQVNCRYASQLVMKNCQIDTGLYSLLCSLPTHTASVGLWPPTGGNGGWTRLMDVSIVGCYAGMVTEEHTHGDNIAITACLYGMSFAIADHSSYFSRLNIENCQNGMNYGSPGVGTHRTRIAAYNIEHAPTGAGWQETVYDVIDDTNSIYGDLHWSVVKGGVGQSVTFTKKGGGAQNLSCLRIGTEYPRKSVAVLAANLSIASGTGGADLFLTNAITEVGVVDTGGTAYFVISEPGEYAIQGIVSFAAAVGGTFRKLELIHDTLGLLDHDERLAAAGGFPAAQEIQLKVNRTMFLVGTAPRSIKLRAYQDSGAGLNVIGNSNYSGILTVMKLRSIPSA